MRGAWSVLVVVCLGAAITMYQMAGIGAVLGLAGTSDLQSDDTLQNSSGNLDPNDEGLTGAADEQEGSIVGLIIGGGQAIFTFLGAVVLLPFEMHSLGFPWWFSFPIGLVLQIHAGIAGIQFGVNRVLR
jgi:hypothetical protein